MDELLLANECLVFKWVSLDPEIEGSEIVASIHVNKVTPQIITTITELVRDTMVAFGLDCVMEVSDAAGCNWVAFKDIMATHSYNDILPDEITENPEYSDIDFDLTCVTQDPVTGDYFIFMPDMPHLTKNIVTALELSSSKASKRNIKYGKCPVNLGMGEEIWLKTGGATGQFHTTKLTVLHFDKNAFSRMNVSLATQFLSGSVARMIKDAINDDEISLSLREKGMYSHLANLCEKWNYVVDVCNGKDGPHDPKVNASERRDRLLEILAWFSRWRAKHDALVAKGEATKYNFFADETWFCIRALLLGQIATIQIYCIEKGEKVRPSSTNTDPCEWFFGDARQMVGGSTNKLTCRGMEHAVKKSTAFNKAKYNLIGNNKTGKDHFGKRRKF